MSDPKYAAFRALAPCPQFEPAVGSIYLFEASVAVDMSRGRNARIRGAAAGSVRTCRVDAGSGQTSCAISRHWRINARSIRASSRARRLRIPCFREFIALAALPPSVFGPLDRTHGFQARISAACRSRRSGVQPLLMVQSQ